jgi:hypothetical protein
LINNLPASEDIVKAREWNAWEIKERTLINMGGKFGKPWRDKIII